jgi:leucyl/phenylalanyl-tRNA--protein transferase
MSNAYYQLETGRVAYLEADCPFPPLNDALTEPNGLLAIGGALTQTRLLDAYKKGIFPWFTETEPVMWWSPSPRMVLFTDELKVSKSLAKAIKKQPFTIKFNTNFRGVISACSQTPRDGQDGTWITEDIINAYCQLHEAGHAISAEAWDGDTLVGGCYGIKIGNMFYGESMFHHATDASKIAFVAMVQKLQADGVPLIDCQMKTTHLASFGAREISREAFLEQLSIHTNADQSHHDAD